VYRAVDALLNKAFNIPGLCNSRLAFAVAGAGNLKEVYSCRFDGSEARRITHNGSISTEPTWGGNGQLLVYTLYQNNATSVVLVDVTNDRQKRLSRFPGLNAGADLSPDAQWAAITLSKDRRVDLFILSAQTGQIARQVTNDLAAESSPCWSPRGDQLCYVSDRAGKPQLFLVAAGGGSSSRLLRESEETVSPDWSPVSNKICFAVRLGNEYAIGVVDMADSSRKREIITNAAGSWESPSWAPDCRHVVCSRRVQSRRELYMVDTWHPHLTPITKSGDYSLPSWSTVLP
jgi:TolB protein